MRAICYIGWLGWCMDGGTGTQAQGRGVNCVADIGRVMRPVFIASMRAVVRLMPDVLSRLNSETRFVLSEPAEYKTYTYFRDNIIGLVYGVYYNNLGGIFIDTMANLISGQLTDAYWRAWASEGFFSEIPDWLNSALEQDILNQYSYVDQFYRDIVDARIDKLPIDPLLARADMWANQYNNSYNEAIRLINLKFGGKLTWVYGDADHCGTCRQLNGLTAFASEWEAAGVRPQSPPNPVLDCGGWRCACSLVHADKRRSPRAMESIMNAVNK